MAEFFTGSPAQGRFADAVLSGDYRYLAYGGGIRSGKSFGVFLLLQALARIFPRSRWAIVRKDLPTIRRNVLPTFEKVRVPGFTGELNQSSWSYPCANGSEIILFTESLSEDPELNRWRGLEVNGFALEEANELQEKSFNKAIERAGAWIVPGLQTQPPPLIICTFNPSAGWVKRKFYDPHRSGTLRAPFYYQPATIFDNPHLPADYVASLKNLPERDYKRFVEGDWSFISGAFFDELNWDTHGVPSLANPVLPDRWQQLPSWWRYWGSYDWGFRHPAVAMGWAMDGDGNVFLLDTVRMHKLSDEEQAQRVRQSLPSVCLAGAGGMYAGHDAFSKIQAHSPRHESVADIFLKHGIRLSHANIARIPGWAAMRRHLTPKQSDGTLGTPRVRICDTPGNRWAFDQWMELLPDATEADDVEKIDANEDGFGGDDCGDCGRYGLASPSWLPSAPVVTPDLFVHGDNPNTKASTTERLVLDTNPINDHDFERGVEGGMSSRMGQGW